MFCELPWVLETRVRNGAKFKRCISDYSPDLVVSLHPLTQHLPLHVMRSLDSEGILEKPAFATVCTDLGSAHPSWFVKGVDACFVPSDAVRRVATRRGLSVSQIKQYGLPCAAPPAVPPTTSHSPPLTLCPLASQRAASVLESQRAAGGVRTAGKAQS